MLQKNSLSLDCKENILKEVQSALSMCNENFSKYEEIEDYVSSPNFKIIPSNLWLNQNLHGFASHVPFDVI